MRPSVIVVCRTGMIALLMVALVSTPAAGQQPPAPGSPCSQMILPPPPGSIRVRALYAQNLTSDFGAVRVAIGTGGFYMGPGPTSGYISVCWDAAFFPNGSGVAMLVFQLSIPVSYVTDLGVAP